MEYIDSHLRPITDKQWQVTENILDPQHRKRKYSLRDIMDAIMYVVKTGCQWRMLPRDFPPFNTVFYYFNKWKLEGIFEQLVETLHVAIRKLMGREDTPSVGIIDSRSIKSSHHMLIVTSMHIRARLRKVRKGEIASGTRPPCHFCIKFLRPCRQ